MRELKRLQAEIMARFLDFIQRFATTKNPPARGNGSRG